MKVLVLVGVVVSLLFFEISFASTNKYSSPRPPRLEIIKKTVGNDTFEWWSGTGHAACFDADRYWKNGVEVFGNQGNFCNNYLEKLTREQARERLEEVKRFILP